MKIVVVGGGIGGLTAALALLRERFTVDVVEAAPAWGDVGAGVTLAPNAMLAFQALGVGDAITACSIEPDRQDIRHWQDGRTLLAVARGTRMREQYGAPYLYTHRADLHRVLLDAVERQGGRIHLGAAVTRVEIEGCGIVHLADGRAIAADLVVGADGLKSVVRTLYGAEAAHFTGHVAWRALVPVDKALADLAALPGMFVGPGRMAVFYPLREGRLLNMVLFAREDGWTQEGWTIPASAAELARVFAGWCEPVQALIAAAGTVPLYKWAINARMPLACWSIGDRVTLLGDAAHAMTPFMGQGASTAIEDAVVLARTLAASDSIGEALRRYEAARMERTSSIQGESNANADRLQGSEADMFGLVNLRNEETLGLFAYDSARIAI